MNITFIKHRKKLALLLGLFSICTGCTHVPSSDSTQVSKLVEPRIGKKVHWHQAEKEDAQIDDAIGKLLQNELSVDTAIQIALINNRSLQALYEEIGISQADIVQAGLLQNPLFTAAIGFPTQGGASISSQFSIAQNFIDAFSISLRKKYAQVLLEQTELKIANAVIDHVSKVERAYYKLQAEMSLKDQLEKITELESAAVALSERQQKAGNVYDIQVVNHKKKLYQTKISQTKTEAQILVLREHLNELLGLFGDHTTWKIPRTLPSIPVDEINVNDLENLAISNRLDLKAAKKEVELMATALGLKEWWTYTEGQIGVLQQRDSEGVTSIGPSLGFAIPLFDCGQANRAKFQAKLKQSYEQMMGLIVQIRAEVRAARETLVASQKLAEYLLKVVSPLQSKTMQLSQKLYNSMTISTYQLLAAKRKEIETQIEYIEALREYWLSRVDLGNTIGGKLLLFENE